jgi:hypothetical protein
MSDVPYGLIEMAIFFSLPLLWALWELRKLRQERAKDARKAESETDATK